MVKTGNKILKTLILALVLETGVNAANYVSFRGGFYIQYPDDWVQVPYLTADMFLARTAPDPTTLNYEAIFAPKSSEPFFVTDYLILTLDSVEWMFPYMVDSVVDEMNKSFMENLEYYRIEELPSDLRTGRPVFDQNKKMISVVNDILAGDKIVRKNYTVKRLYDKGVVNFYFYSPDSLFAASRPIFEKIVNSFSTENVLEAVPKEEGKVSGDKTESYDKRSMLIPVGAAIIILLILIIRVRKAARTKKQMGND